MIFQRRHFLVLLGAGVGAFALDACASANTPTPSPPATPIPTPTPTPPGSSGAIQLPPLPYDYNALEPHIDEATMRFHHDKHHATYVKNLNAALDKYPVLKTKM